MGFVASKSLEAGKELVVYEFCGPFLRYRSVIELQNVSILVGCRLDVPGIDFLLRLPRLDGLSRSFGEAELRDSGRLWLSHGSLNR